MKWDVMMISKKIGKYYPCKHCNEEYIQQYKQQVCCSIDCQLNRTKNNMRSHVIENRQKISNRMSLYIKNKIINDDEYRKKYIEYWKKYYFENKEKLKTYKKKYAAKNREKINLKRRLKYHANKIKELENDY